MATRRKRVFISDIHLGMNASWDWYQPNQHEAPLLELLHYVRSSAGGVKDLVLNGDLFETWMCPIGSKPPTIAEILTKHDRVLAAINAVCDAGVDVFYAPGNHDMTVKSTDLAARLPKVKVVKRYNSGLLYAEHGSRFAMFNAPDTMHDPSDGLPLGYFITRILAGHSDYTRPRAVLRYVDDLLEAAFTSQKLAESVVEALAEHAGHSLDDAIAMPGTRRSITLREVQRKYATLFDRWVEKFGLRYAIRSIAAEGGELGWFADREAERRDYRVVVLGAYPRSRLRRGRLARAQPTDLRQLGLLVSEGRRRRALRRGRQGRAQDRGRGLSIGRRRAGPCQGRLDRVLMPGLSARARRAAAHGS